MHSAAEKDYPLVSVIIPTYNQGKYLRQCIESALSQDYPNLEVIVVDNGSTDNTPEILSSFGDKIRCQKEEKRGPGAARNRGIEISRGEFIAFLDSDDYYLPGKITLSVQKLIEDHSVSMVYADYVLVDTENCLLEKVKTPYPNQEEFARCILVKGFITGSSVIIRRECFAKIGFYRTEFLAAQDCDLWLRLLKSGYHFGHIPRILFAYRWHPGNISHKKKFVRFYSDKVHSKALSNFTHKELFGDLVRENDWKGVKIGYEKLAKKLYKRHLFATAGLALKKASEIEVFSFRSLFSLPALKLRTNLRRYWYWKNFTAN